MNADGTLSLSNPEGKIFEFNLHDTVDHSDSSYKYLSATVPSGATCFVSFDYNGTPLANQCSPLSGPGEEFAKVQINTG